MKAAGKEMSFPLLMVDRGDESCFRDGMESSHEMTPTEGVIVFGDDADGLLPSFVSRGSTRRLVSLYRGGLHGVSMILFP